MNRYEPLLTKSGEKAVGVTPFYSTRTSTLPLSWLYAAVAVAALATVFIVAAHPAVLVTLVVIGVFMLTVTIQSFIKNYTSYREEEDRKAAYLKTTVIPYFTDTYDAELPEHILNALLDGRGKAVTVAGDLQYVRLVKSETNTLVLAKDITKLPGNAESSSDSFIFFPVTVTGETSSSSSDSSSDGDSGSGDSGGDGGGGGD